jgi:hypothetical protein
MNDTSINTATADRTRYAEWNEWVAKNVKPSQHDIYIWLWYAEPAIAERILDMHRQIEHHAAQVTKLDDAVAQIIPLPRMGASFSAYLDPNRFEEVLEVNWSPVQVKNTISVRARDARHGEDFFRSILDSLERTFKRDVVPRLWTQTEFAVASAFQAARRRY